MLTIIVATKNRSDFMIRLLDYYADTDYKHWIYIGDSSDSFHFERTQAVIDQLKDKLKVRIYRCPDLNVRESVGKLLETVTTPYVCHIGDDDFLVTAALEDCIEFLESNKGYVGANGRGAVFSLKNSGAKGRFHSLGSYAQKGVEADTAVDRLSLYLKDRFVTLFSVQRLPVWKLMYKDNSSILDRALGDELLPCCLSVIQGKIKHLKGLYLFRQVHDKRNLFPNSFDWIMDSNWLPSYKGFRDSLIQALIEKDGIGQEPAERVIKQVFWRYLKSALSAGYAHHYGGAKRSRLIGMKKVLKGIPGISKTVNNIKSVVSSSKNLSLPALLNRYSPYHNDFMPVYRAITKN